LLKESLPLGLAVIFTLIYFRLDTLMLSLMKPAADVGIYNLGYKFLESLIFFPTMFIGLVMPLMSEYALSAKEKFRKVVQKALDVLLIFAIPLMIGILFLSERMVVLIAGQEFVLSSGVLDILIIAVGIIFLSVLFSNMIISLRKQKALVYIYGLGAIINLIANFIFIPKYSYYGAAATTVITEFVVVCLMLIVLFKILRYLPSFRSFVKPFLAGLVMALLLYFLADLSLFILIFLGALVYFFVLYLLDGASIKKVLSLIQKEV